MRAPLLYLDFDGVLHHEDVRVYRGRGIVCSGGPLFEHLPVLVELLAGHPGVRIVLSTSWVRMRSYSFARRQLGPLVGRVVGATFHSHMRKDEFVQLSRGMQVWADVVQRGAQHWVAIDDEVFGWPAWCRDRLVASDPVRGLGMPQVRDALAAALRGLVDDATA